MKEKAILYIIYVLWYLITTIILGFDTNFDIEPEIKYLAGVIFLGILLLIIKGDD